MGAPSILTIFLEIEEVTGIPVFLFKFAGIPNSLKKYQHPTFHVANSLCPHITLIQTQQGWRIERQGRKGRWGEMTNTKGLLKRPIKTQYC